MIAVITSLVRAPLLVLVTVLASCGGGGGSGDSYSVENANDASALTKDPALAVFNDPGTGPWELVAAEALIEALEWDKESIDAVLFVTQTPDYILPATACILQYRLGLSSHCAALDVNLGCSGYVYGLWWVGLACGSDELFEFDVLY